MRTYDLILKKRNGYPLDTEEISYLINEYTTGQILDYQMAAWCMATYFTGMTDREISDLTMAMARSGEIMDLGTIQGRKIDKHSTGGVGDTTTLIVAPLVASCGVSVAKMSGKGLGHTGGTIDKLSSIPGFNSELTQDQFIRQVNDIHCALVSQTGKLAPADKLLYALRDVTATVDSIPLIASSIMSKKIAAGADGFVLDVKTGSGAFMKELSQAIELAKTMVSIGKQIDKPTVALVTDMNQPLGQMIGNALEVKEAILTLANQGPDDLTQLCIALGAEMLVLAEHSPDILTAEKQLLTALRQKTGLDKFKAMIRAQGGDERIVDSPDRLPQAQYKIPIYSNQAGYIESIDSLELGLAAMNIGAGREHKNSPIDLAVGLELKKKIGDYVTIGEPIVIVHSNMASSDQEKIRAAYTFSDKKVSAVQLIHMRNT